MIEAYFDGACEPRNPGGALGIGAWMMINGKRYTHSDFVSTAPQNTNNVAEYMAFEKILDTLLERNLSQEEIIIRGDSKLVIEQMFGDWQIRSGVYKPAAIRCKIKVKEKFSNIRGIWIPRIENQFADDLSKKALISNNIKITVR